MRSEIERLLAMADQQVAAQGCCGGHGRSYGDADWMRLLRQGVNRHRIDCGVLRLGGPAKAEALISRWGWAEWIGLPAVTMAHADELLQEELLDGLVLDAEHCHCHSG